MLNPPKTSQIDYETQKTLDEIQALLRIMKDPKFAVFRLLYWQTCYRLRRAIHDGQAKLAKNLEELANACLSDCGGEELLSSPYEWERELSLDRDALRQMLTAYGRILVRNGMTGSKSILWINYILEKMEEV